MPSLMLALLSAATRVPDFTGIWLADLDTQSLPAHPDVYLVAHGQYRCDSCEPRRDYPADGRPHPVPGDANVSSESVTVAGPRTIVTRIVGPALTRETRMTVARDGRTATYVSIDHRPNVAGALRTVYLARRVAPAPPGAHPVSGSWQGIRYVSVPDQVRTTELRVDGNVFSYSVPIGVAYTAAIDGAAAPVHGPYPGRVEAAVRRIDRLTLLETRRQDGRIILERRFRLSPDGRALEIASTDPVSNTTFRITAHRRARTIPARQAR